MTGSPVEVYLSAGSNVEPERWLAMACRELAASFGPLRCSPVYRNPAVGFQGDDFLNLVIAFPTTQSPDAVSEVLEQLHDRAGRRRSGSSFSPRTLDLDLLLYGDQVIERPGLHVPRADILKYAFVLGPLAELDPGLRHPVDGRTMRELWAAFDRTSAPPMTRVALRLPGAGD